MDSGDINNSGNTGAAAAAGSGPELKGGHAPATKVGGMRVVQHKPHKEETAAAAKMTPEEVEEFGEEPKKASSATVVVSGAKASEDAAFPAEAVKAFHEKPQPTHDNKNMGNKPKIIHQPKK